MVSRIPAFLRPENRPEPIPSIGLAGADLTAAPRLFSALRTLQRLGRLSISGLWEPNNARREAAGDYFQIPADHRLADPDDLLSPQRRAPGPRLHAVLVTTNSPDRPELIHKILSRKLHVLTLPGNGETAEDTERLLDHASASGAHWGILHVARYQAIYAEPLGAIRQGEIGEILHIRIERSIHFLESKPERETRPDPLYRDIYLARAWARSPVISIFARLEERHSRRSDFTLSLVYLQHAGGSGAAIHHIQSPTPPTEVIEIHGTEGGIRIDPPQNQWHLGRMENASSGPDWISRTPHPVTLRGEVQLEGESCTAGSLPYARALDDALGSFARGLPAPVDARESWLTLRAMEAIRESARTGEVVRVDIPFSR